MEGSVAYDRSALISDTPPPSEQKDGNVAVLRPASPMIHPRVNSCMRSPSDTNMYGVSNTWFPLDPSDNNCIRPLKEHNEEDDAKYQSRSPHVDNR